MDFFSQLFALDQLAILVAIIVIIALVFDFVNGMNDAANSVATIVGTGVLSPRAAVAWAAFFNFAAYGIFGVHVANTIGKGIVHADIMLNDPWFIMTSLLGAIIWAIFCTLKGWPISISHALIGGLVGSALFKGGIAAIITSKIFTILIFIILAPLMGFVIGYIFMIITLYIVRGQSPLKVDGFFRVMQLVSSAAFSLGHGGNDAQKTMGIIAVLLFSTGYLGSEFYVPTWVVFSAYTCISLGTLIGGWKVIRTLGVKLTDLKPIHGFCAETAGALTLFGVTFAGIPVSTTHTITGSIMGVGVTRRLSAVKWGVAKHIVGAWIFTLPATMILSALFYFIYTLFI